MQSLSGLAEAESTNGDGPPIRVETVEDLGAVVLALNQPDDRNPVDEATIAELIRLLGVLYDSGDTIRAVILTGMGTSFSAGGNLKKYQEMFRDRSRQSAFVESFGEACKLLERAPFLSVAMVNGACVAGGTELALACDLITIADEARIGDGHLRFSQCPGSGAQRLIRAIGVQRARHWLLSGELFDAQTAVQVGLAVGRAPREELRDYTLNLVRAVCQASPLMVSNIKQLVVTAMNERLDDALEIEERMAVEYATTSVDAMEGLRAFAEKRPPRYIGM